MSVLYSREGSFILFLFLFGTLEHRVLLCISLYLCLLVLVLNSRASLSDAKLISMANLDFRCYQSGVIISNVKEICDSGKQIFPDKDD